MSKFVKKIEKIQIKNPESEMKNALDTAFDRVVTNAVSLNKQFVKEEEVKEAFKVHKDFSKKATLNNPLAHKYYYYRRTVYGQLRGKQRIKGQINNSGQAFRASISHESLDPWNYNIDYVIKNDVEKFNIETSFESYQCYSCTGQRSVVCSKCDCKGRVQSSIDNSWDTCNECKGTGYVSCGTCDGYGSLMDYTVIEVEHKVHSYSEKDFNNDYKELEEAWMGSEYINAKTIESYNPFDDQKFVSQDQLQNSPDMLEFLGSSANYFDRKDLFTYLLDHEFYVNELNGKSCEVDYNGKKIRALYKDDGKLEIDPVDMLPFFEDELSGIRDIYNTRKRNRKIMISAIVSCLVLAVIGYYYNNSLENEKIRQAQIKKYQEEQRELAMKQKKFSENYKNVMRLVRKKQFADANTKMQQAIKEYPKAETTYEQDAVIKALSGLVSLNADYIAQNNIGSKSIRDRILKGTADNSDIQYSVCNYIPGCKDRNVPNILKTAYSEKYKKIVKGNYRKLASASAEHRLNDQAGELKYAKNRFERSIASYLEENAYPDKYDITYTSTNLIKRKGSAGFIRGAWNISGIVSVDGEKLNFEGSYDSMSSFSFKKK